MVFNPVILGAIVVQGLTSKVSRVAGAVVGYLITTGILMWGFSVYDKGNHIEFFGISLSQSHFVIACLIWFGFDTKVYLAAKKPIPQPQDPPPPAVPDPAKRAEEKRTCFRCGAGYHPEDYRADASEWLCSSCGNLLVRDR
jgi:hypothetical protein